MPQQMQRPAYYQVPGSGPAGPTLHGARPRWPSTTPIQRIPTSTYGGPPPRGAPSGRHGGPPVPNAARQLVQTGAPRPITGPASMAARQPTTARPPQAGRQAAAFNAAKPIRAAVSIIDA